jgi:hypothetical protein
MDRTYGDGRSRHGLLAKSFAMKEGEYDCEEVTCGLDESTSVRCPFLSDGQPAAVA